MRRFGLVAVVLLGGCGLYSAGTLPPPRAIVASKIDLNADTELRAPPAPPPPVVVASDSATSSGDSGGSSGGGGDSSDDGQQPNYTPNPDQQYQTQMNAYIDANLCGDDTIERPQ